MNSIGNRIILFVMCIILLTPDFVWSAAPPNPTESDENGNTAGGSGVLVNNIGTGNTGFGVEVLNQNTTGHSNIAIGQKSLFNNTEGDSNIAIGIYALFQNTTGEQNTAIGGSSLFSNTTGHNNIAINGMWANTTGNMNTGIGGLFSNTTGNWNVAVGGGSMSGNKTGLLNTAVGVSSLDTDQSGKFNTVVGAGAMQGHTKGDGNVAFGFASMNTSVEGSLNTSLGHMTLSGGMTGSNNIALGAWAGKKLTHGDHNIYLDNVGRVEESGVIRIGNAQWHQRVAIAGISGKSVASGSAVPVVVDRFGNLGTVLSSARFKKDIKDMDKASEKLMQLRPVTYRYKQADDNGDNPLEYGLIAEEVAKVYPDLVAYGVDGKIETVQYQKLTPMLLNEVQRLNKLLIDKTDADRLLLTEVNSLKQQVQNKNSQFALAIETLKNQSKTIESLNVQLSQIKEQEQLMKKMLARINKLEAQQTVVWAE
jgi:hypothetical protein